MAPNRHRLTWLEVPIAWAGLLWWWIETDNACIEDKSLKSLQKYLLKKNFQQQNWKVLQWVKCEYFNRNEN